MTKKSFFERLTGATNEETPGLSKNKIEPLNKVNFEEPNMQPKISQPKLKQKEQMIPASPTNKEEYPSGQEGQLLVDIYQTENEIIIKSAAAGIKSEDVDVSITENIITIKGIRRKNEPIPQDKYDLQEIYWGPFSRSIILGGEIDPEKVHASIKEGILTIKLPKLEKSKTKTIKVREIE